MRRNPGAFLLGFLGLAALPGMAAEPLGRLFMTAEQRRELDALREPGGDVLTDASRLAQPDAAPVESQVVLNGVVRRSRGPDVVWVNGRRTGEADARIRLRKGPDAANRVTLETPADGSSVRLKPGQYWEPSTGRVANCYGCGTTPKAAEVTPAPAEATADKP
jgi:hypothetical protein